MSLSVIGKLIVKVACNVGALFWFSAIAAIFDVKSRGRLGRVESVNNGVGIRAKENGEAGRGRGGFFSPWPPRPLSPTSKILKIQHGGYDLTTNRDSGFRAPPENACIAGHC